MHILLQILAVIGIILLCIIGLILVVLGLVLFVPVRYRLYAQKESAFLAKLKITWLLHLVTVGFEYPEPKELVLRVCGYKINLNKQDEVNEEPLKEEVKVDLEDIEEAQEEKMAGIAQPFEREGAPETKRIDAEDLSGDRKEAKKKTAKDSSFKKIQYKIREICAKIKEIITEIRYYWDLLQKKENRLLLERIKKWLLKIFKSIRPKVISVNAVIGTGAPDTTGYLLAVYGILSPLYGYQMQITPDFENKIFEGTIFVKGKITVFVLLYYGARIYFDKQLQKLIAMIKERDNKNGRKSI